MKRPAIKAEVRSEIIETLDLAAISKKIEYEANRAYDQHPIMGFSVPIGKFILMPEKLLKYNDETIIGVCLDFFNEEFGECQVSIYRKQKSKRHRVAFAKCAMITVMVVTGM